MATTSPLSLAISALTSEWFFGAAAFVLFVAALEELAALVPFFFFFFFLGFWSAGGLGLDGSGFGTCRWSAGLSTEVALVADLVVLAGVAAGLVSFYDLVSLDGLVSFTGLELLEDVALEALVSLAALVALAP